MMRALILSAAIFGATVSQADPAVLKGEVDTTEYINCSAFFAVLSRNLPADSSAVSRFQKMSEDMLDASIESSDDYRGVGLDELAVELMKKMQKSEADAKAVIQRYAIPCKHVYARWRSPEQYMQDPLEE